MVSLSPARLFQYYIMNLDLFKNVGHLLQKLEYYNHYKDFIILVNNKLNVTLHQAVIPISDIFPFICSISVRLPC